MRIDETRLGASGTAELLDTLADLGVDTLHSSLEYESFSTFAEAVRILRSNRPEWQPVHIVKLAEPHFGFDRFDSERFCTKVDEYRRELATDRLDVVQWMSRGNVNNPTARRAILRRDANRIADCVGELRRDGTLGALVMFPYEDTDVRDTLVYDWCDGVAVYLNAGELGWVHAVDEVDRTGKGAVVLRPFGAGKALDAISAARRQGWGAGLPDARCPSGDCVRLPLLHPAVASVIGSVSTPEHAAVAAASSQVDSSMPLFSELIDDLVTYVGGHTR